MVNYFSQMDWDIAKDVCHDGRYDSTLCGCQSRLLDYKSQERNAMNHFTCEWTRNEQVLAEGRITERQHPDPSCYVYDRKGTQPLTPITPEDFVEWYREAVAETYIDLDLWREGGWNAVQTAIIDVGDQNHLDISLWTEENVEEVHEGVKWHIFQAAGRVEPEE